MKIKTSDKFINSEYRYVD